MERQRSYILLLLVSIICAIGFTWLAYLVNANSTDAFDREIISIVQGWEAAWLTTCMTLVTAIGSKVEVAIISLLFLAFLAFVLRHRRELILYVSVLAGTVVLNEILKSLFSRARPEFNRLVEATGYSFPSGHAMISLSLYGVLAYLLWRHMRGASMRSLAMFLCIMIIFIVGLSRIYLGVHFPSDIIAGYLASGSWLALAILLYQRFIAR